MKGKLVIVPCGLGKVWDSDPDRGSVPACEAYNGSPFKVNREYAEHFADRWVILSAKYGFIAPDFPIPGPYNVTFKRKVTDPIEGSMLRKQIKDQKLDRFEMIIGLGGKEYRAIVEEVFHSLPVKLYFPFAGLPIGKAMQAIKQSIASDKL